MVEVRRLGRESETGEEGMERINCDGSADVRMLAVARHVWWDYHGCKFSRLVMTIDQ